MQHGPGAGENAFGGVAQAFSEAVPTWWCRPLSRRLAAYYPNFNSGPEHAPITQWAEPLHHGADGAGRAAGAPFFQLRNGRGGPVLIEWPVDGDEDEEISPTTSSTPGVRRVAGPIRPSLAGRR